jgi:hypothetical protein
VPALTVPESDRIGLALLRELGDGEFNKLLADIAQSPGPVPSINGLGTAAAETLMDAIHSLYRVREYNEVSTDEFISDVCEALLEYKELTPDQQPQFRERLARVLSIDALKVAAKAVSLSTEFEHGYCSARVLTDARPVYGKNPKEAPSAMIITHTLKLSYHDGERGGKLSDFYIALGSGDVSELREALERAEDKAKSLQTALGPSGIRVIDPQQ